MNLFVKSDESVHVRALVFYIWLSVYSHRIVFILKVQYQHSEMNSAAAVDFCSLNFHFFFCFFACVRGFWHSVERWRIVSSKHTVRLMYDGDDDDWSVPYMKQSCSKLHCTDKQLVKLIFMHIFQILLWAGEFLWLTECGCVIKIRLAL